MLPEAAHLSAPNNWVIMEKLKMGGWDKMVDNNTNTDNSEETEKKLSHNNLHSAVVQRHK